MSIFSPVQISCVCKHAFAFSIFLSKKLVDDAVVCKFLGKKTIPIVLLTPTVCGMD